ncbi:hypothetical protein [uncultured Tateyamaria sp.]|uniref:hypothetical protein n=1 Tax=uncultured Tateyamaria sp. TaxID=455651 RepID=UPI0026036BC1|nr:hypothetical protein [uncultured Tateyamaria sp.]
MRIGPAALSALSLSFVSPAMLSAEDLHLGFEIGGTLEQARIHAYSNGWTLRPLPEELQRIWVIDGVDADLYICKNRVLAVRRQFDGGIDEFTKLVQQVQRDKGLPDTNVITFRSGVRRISNVDARFEVDDGTEILVQLSSIDGEVGVSTNVWLAEACADQIE